MKVYLKPLTPRQLEIWKEALGPPIPEEIKREFMRFFTNDKLRPEW